MTEPREIDLDFSKCRAQTLAYNAFTPGHTVCIPWGRGIGKALAIDTRIPTPLGWTTMGELSVGDQVLDENGKPCNVLAATEVMADRVCYEVSFDDGTSIVADADHRWFTWDKRARKSHGRSGPGRHPTCNPDVRTTQQIFETLKVNHGRETNHSVGLAGPLRLTGAALPLHPYLLGYWLGNGNTDTPALTIGGDDAEEILGLLRQFGAEIGKLQTKANGCTAVHCRMLGMTDTFRALGVLGNKHVPRTYLRGSEQQRRDLLAGLLDSDGYASKDGGTVEFTSTLRGLADAVRELASSLGFKPSLVSEGRATLNGVDCGPKFRVTFTPRTQVFYLTRKHALVRQPGTRAQANRTTHHYIVDVKPVDSVPVRCITVDSPSHLFLAGESMVPTHNSFFARMMAYSLVTQWDGKRRPGATLPGVRIVVLLPTLEQAKKVHAASLTAELGPLGDWEHLKAKIDRTTWRVTFPGGSWIQFVSAERVNLLRGIRCDAVFVDEADDIDPASFDSVVKPWFSEPHSLRQMMIGGTPRRGRKGLLWHAHHELPKVDPERYFSFHATAYDAPTLVDPQYVEDTRKTTAETIFKREWLCDFDSAEGLVYGSFMEGFHVRHPAPDVVWNDIVVGADHGWEDHGATVVFGILGHGNDALAWALYEIYEQHKDLDWWLAEQLRVRDWYPSSTVFPDPSRPDVINSWRRSGIRIGKTENDIEAGVATVQNLLKIRTRPAVGGGEEEYARLYISPNCPNLINELGLYRRKRDPRNPERILESIVDKDNHLCDASRYALVGKFGLTNLRGRRNVDAGFDNRH